MGELPSSSPTKELVTTTTKTLATGSTTTNDDDDDDNDGVSLPFGQPSDMFVWLLIVVVLVLFVVWTVLQVKNNPHGLCAAVFNVIVVLLDLIVKIILFP